MHSEISTGKASTGAGKVVEDPEAVIDLDDGDRDWFLARLFI